LFRYFFGFLNGGPYTGTGCVAATVSAETDREEKSTIHERLNSELKRLAGV